MIEELLNSTIRKFIIDNEREDAFQLSLKYKEVDGVPFHWIAQQILGRQKIKTKIPEWYECENIIYPVKLSLEQSSSQKTAEYKASLVSGNSFIDLTTGMGVDSWALSKSFINGISLEQNEELSEITSHNLKVLGCNQVEVVNQLAEEFLNSSEENFDLIYLDPARRVETKKVFLLEDCVPNIVELLPELKKRSKAILIKTSPLMDIHQSIKELPGVTDVHVVSVNNDCKEVLYHLSGNEKTLEIHTVNFKNEEVEKLDFNFDEEANSEVKCGQVQSYLYEPNSAILKAGAFKSIAPKLGVIKLHPNTHLYSSEHLVPNFPGRAFMVENIMPYSKKELKGKFDQNKANVTVRNFPDSVEKIRKKLGLKDGGDVYLFAITDYQGKLQILNCTKVNKS